MPNFDNGPVIKPNPTTAPAQETKVATKTNVSLPPANAAIQNAVNAVSAAESRIASLHNEGQSLFALDVAPKRPVLDPRSVRKIAQDEAPNPRELAKKFLG